MHHNIFFAFYSDVNQQNKVTNSAPQIVENVLSQHHIIESSNAHKEMYENMNFHRNRKVRE